MSYMPQRVFNACAVTAAKIAASTGKSIQTVAEEVAANYATSYQDQPRPEDVAEAASKVTAFLEGAMPEESIVGVLTQMQFCIKNYDPSGEKLRKRIFGGTWFNKESAPIKDKVGTCVANIATFHLLTINGQIPIAPRGWHI